MCVFNVGLTYGLGAIGAQTGAVLPAAFMEITISEISPIYTAALGLALVILFAWFMGFGATLAEPALNALGLTVQNLTNGAFRKSVLMYSVATGVAFGIALGIAKILFEIDLAMLLIPLYLIALVLTFSLPKNSSMWRGTAPVSPPARSPCRWCSLWGWGWAMPYRRLKASAF